MLPNTIIFLFGIFIVIIVFVLLRKEIFNGTSKSNQSFKENENELLKNIEIADDIIQEMNELSERIISQLDNKIFEINQLLKKVDEAINILSLESLNEKIDFEECEVLEEFVSPEETCTVDIRKEDYLKDNQEIIKIIELADKGYAPFEIAKQLNKGIGEINLILNIKKR